MVVFLFNNVNFSIPKLILIWIDQNGIVLNIFCPLDESKWIREIFICIIHKYQSTGILYTLGKNLTALGLAEKYFS